MLRPLIHPPNAQCIATVTDTTDDGANRDDVEFASDLDPKSLATMTDDFDEVGHHVGGPSRVPVNQLPLVDVLSSVHRRENEGWLLRPNRMLTPASTVRASIAVTSSVPARQT